ncbi:hypothetical protein [Phyllobacterium sp. SB3]|uniref:hypothetical protein n=1 Tax=Phyllobacterium sp. SB3 TaxID=3156073 RepID=UPI0032AFCD54
MNQGYIESNSSESDKPLIFRLEMGLIAFDEVSPVIDDLENSEIDLRDHAAVLERCEGYVDDAENLIEKIGFVSDELKPQISQDIRNFFSKPTICLIVIFWRTRQAFPKSLLFLRDWVWLRPI